MKHIRVTSYKKTSFRLDIRQAEYDKRKHDYFSQSNAPLIMLNEGNKESSKQVKPK